MKQSPSDNFEPAVTLYRKYNGNRIYMALVKKSTPLTGALFSRALNIDKKIISIWPKYKNTKNYRYIKSVRMHFLKNGVAARSQTA